LESLKLGRRRLVSEQQLQRFIARLEQNGH
jgi:hypothetical protein